MASEKVNENIPLEGDGNHSSGKGSVVSDEIDTNPEGITEKKLLRKLDLKLLPPLTLLYLLSFLDRSNGWSSLIYIQRTVIDIYQWEMPDWRVSQPISTLLAISIFSH
jgi:hypothetical protein